MIKRSSSSQQTDNEANNELESLFDKIDEIEQGLEPLRDAQSDLLRSQTEDKKKKLESLADGELSPLKLSFLRKEIGKLKERAESLANNSFIVATSFLQSEVDEIEQALEPLKNADANALRSEKEASKQKLTSVNKTDLPSLREEIRNIKERTGALVTQSFLSAEIELIEKILASIKDNRSKRTELRSLELEKEAKKKKLQSADEYGLASLRKDIGKLKERAESLAAKESWFARLKRVSIVVWLWIIPLLIAIYTGYIAIWQGVKQPTIQAIQLETSTAQTATAAVLQTETAGALQTASAVSIPNDSTGAASATSTPVPTATK